MIDCCPCCLRDVAAHTDDAFFRCVAFARRMRPGSAQREAAEAALGRALFVLAE